MHVWDTSHKCLLEKEIGFESQVQHVCALGTVPGKSKLTVSTRNSILDPRCFHESSFEARVSSLEDRVSRYSKNFLRLLYRDFEERIISRIQNNNNEQCQFTWRVLKIWNLTCFDFLSREYIYTISGLCKYWNLLNRNVKYIWYSLVISRKLHAEAQAVAQMTSKQQSHMTPWICIIDRQSVCLSFAADISVSKPLRKEIKPAKHSTFEGTICNKDSTEAPSSSRLYYCERICQSLSKHAPTI